MIDRLMMIDKIKALLSQKEVFSLAIENNTHIIFYIISYLLLAKHLLTFIVYNDLYNNKLEVWIKYIFVTDEHIHLTTFFT